MTLAPNEVIDGKYRIERLLGQGGMGAVYVAEELGLSRRVAMKVLLPGAAANADLLARFEREGRAAAALESDHVTRIFGVGRLASGAPYIVMELLDGKDLADTLAERGPLPVQEVVRVVIDACDALAEAHARGIIHRDLKPANLFFAKRANGNVTLKVLDFGISKTTSTAVGAPSHGLTGTSALMGTPNYMSPEQIRDARDVDARTDIWALGVTMYELLVGSVPFSGSSLADLCVAVLMNPHASITARRTDVPPAFEAIVNRCLAKDAAARFSTATELANALRALDTLSMRPESQPNAPPAPPLNSSGPNHGRGVAPTEAMTINPVTTSQQREWTVPKTPIAVFVVGGILTLVLGGVGLFALGKLGNQSAVGTNADAAVGLVAAPAVVEAGVTPPVSIAPLVPVPAPAALPAPAKSAAHSNPERTVTVRPSRVQPIASSVPAAPAAAPPVATTKSHAASDGPPPINFERR
jgi:serine/threonine-protein kinase